MGQKKKKIKKTFLLKENSYITTIGFQQQQFKVTVHRITILLLQGLRFTVAMPLTAKAQSRDNGH